MNADDVLAKVKRLKVQVEALEKALDGGSNETGAGAIEDIIRVLVLEKITQILVEYFEVDVTSIKR